MKEGKHDDIFADIFSFKLEKLLWVKDTKQLFIYLSFVLAMFLHVYALG